MNLERLLERLAAGELTAPTEAQLAALAPFLKELELLRHLELLENWEEAEVASEVVDDTDTEAATATSTTTEEEKR